MASDQLKRERERVRRPWPHSHWHWRLPLRTGGSLSAESRVSRHCKSFSITRKIRYDLRGKCREGGITLIGEDSNQFRSPGRSVKRVKLANLIHPLTLRNITPFSIEWRREEGTGYCSRIDTSRWGMRCGRPPRTSSRARGRAVAVSKCRTDVGGGAFFVPFLRSECKKFRCQRAPPTAIRLERETAHYRTACHIST